MKRRNFLGSAGLGLLTLGVSRSAHAGAGSSRPNILFFFPDQHRFDWTSMNPKLPDITPNLRRLASEGVHFGNAFCPSPLCAPSRACLASGKAYTACRVPSNSAAYPLDQTTFYQLLHQAGYHVLGCGKFDLDKPGKNWGSDGKHRRPGAPSLLDVWGFNDGIDNAGKMDGAGAYKHQPRRPEPYFAFLEQRHLAEACIRNFKILDHDYPGPSILPDDAYCDNWIARNGLALLRSVPKGKPWFLQVNFNGPHDPQDVTKSMYLQWKGCKFPEPNCEKTRGDWRKRRNYAAMINNIDHWLGLFREELAARGELENTLIVYCSDHGEMLGDHGLYGKEQPYHPSACVPLLIAGPGIRRGVASNAPIETLDLTATFLDFAGLAPPAQMNSRSLRPYLQETGDLPRTHATSALGHWSLVCDGRYKLVVRRKESRRTQEPSGEFLYDLAEDPGETRNLADQQRGIVAKLRPLLASHTPHPATDNYARTC